jgi:type I restriction enzyme M protein
LFDDLDVNSNKLGGTVEQRNKKLVELLESV